MEQKARMTAKDPAIKVAHQRLSVLQLAEMLGNVSVACKQMGMDRTSFYEWKRRFQTHGLEGLKCMFYRHRFRYTMKIWKRNKSKDFLGLSSTNKHAI